MIPFLNLKRYDKVTHVTRNKHFLRFLLPGKKEREMGASQTKEQRQQWEVLNPEGVIKIEAMKINDHPSTLEGKTVVLR